MRQTFKVKEHPNNVNAMTINRESREEEVKSKIANYLFKKYDTTNYIGNIDFTVAEPSKLSKDEKKYFLWAEAKRGSVDPKVALVQLILTIGKEKIHKKYLPPIFLATFDAEKIMFLRYDEIQDILHMNDFNWNVRPSAQNTKEFKTILQAIESSVNGKYMLFYYEKDKKDLIKFIKENFVSNSTGSNKIKIDRSNFVNVGDKWVEEVMPTIGINWEKAKEKGIIYVDFLFADFFSKNNKTIKDKLFVVLEGDHYVLDRNITEDGLFITKTAEFTDNQMAHNKFWAKYERPDEEDWDYIIERRDLFVPKDVRERKGSYFTPRIWVEKAHEYIKNVLGVDWQDEYYVWDCAAGTGNLLNGLVNKYNIYASTIDKQDVDVMKERINNGLNLLEDHVFQFDFLNDEFVPRSKGGKLPDSLYEIIKDENKRKKLIILINPPYAEATNIKTMTSESNLHKDGLIEENRTKDLYGKQVGKLAREIYILFFLRIVNEIRGCKLFAFSKLKFLLSDSSYQLVNIMRSKYLAGFIVPAYTFDNVKGKFPIAFSMWDTSINDLDTQVYTFDVFNKNGKFIQKKNILKPSFDKKFMRHFIKRYAENQHLNTIANLWRAGIDVQSNRFVFLDNSEKRHRKIRIPVTEQNFLETCVYFSVRHSVNHTWINDRDLFYYPNEDFINDKEFIGDCVIYAIFHTQNKISAKKGINHYIPYKEDEVMPRERFQSHFAYKIINDPQKVIISEASAKVLSVGKEIYRIYHSDANSDPNASFYDIRNYMKNSKNTELKNLYKNMQTYMKKLREQIRKKAIIYGFILSDT
ncbi:MAG: hypothetical protein QXF12_07320 [Candidatus Aenigmatarchaeota archaeon]